MKPFLLIKLFFLLILVFVLCGCDRQARYNIVSTIFTGVPPIDEYYRDKKEIKVIAKKQPKKIVFSHPLRKAQQCELCHGRKVLTGQLGSGSQHEKEESGANNNYSADLLMPPEKLCIKCHVDKTPRRAIRDRLWLHNRVAKGNCLYCHAPHESENIAHLRWPISEICTQCHEHDIEILPEVCRKELLPKEKELGCLSCHNAHMGKNRFLLTRDFQEIKRIVSPVIQK